MASEEGGPSFEATPSWIIGAVAFVIIGVSLGIEKLLTHLGQKLKKNDKTPLYEALQKIKDELMLMGFVSLLLVVVQDNVKHWCIPENWSRKWRPCHARHGLSDENDVTFSCPKGKVPLIALEVLHDLHYLIFVLAVVHVFICTITVLLGEAKLSQWLKWEEYIRIQRQLHDDHADQVIDLRSSTFIDERFQGVEAKKRNYVFSFIKHLGGMVTRADYEAMRMGFILTHGHGNQRFNFHRYMVHAYEADFKKVVSISWFLWLFAVISLALNVAGWNIYFWLSSIPLVFKFSFSSCVMGDLKYVIARLVIM
ncbi:hypothetical protein KSS87_023108 [Heliosperma pusillum]|nr:hypothetical protein KSS87_023108 [Heliosperma pusillum]